VPLLQSSPLPKQSRPAPGKKSNSLTTGSWMIGEIRELVRSKLTGTTTTFRRCAVRQKGLGVRIFRDYYEIAHHSGLFSAVPESRRANESPWAGPETMRITACPTITNNT
jgi:hypothetical protein